MLRTTIGSMRILGELYMRTTLSISRYSVPKRGPCEKTYQTVNFFSSDSSNLSYTASGVVEAVMRRRICSPFTERSVVVCLATITRTTIDRQHGQRVGDMHWESLGHAAHFSQLHVHGVYFVCTLYLHNHWRSYSPPVAIPRQWGPEINPILAPIINARQSSKDFPSALWVRSQRLPRTTINSTRTKLNINLDSRHQLYGIVFKDSTSCICARVTCIVLFSAQLCRC
jgi:hypothetical protein